MHGKSGVQDILDNYRPKVNHRSKNKQFRITNKIIYKGSERKSNVKRNKTMEYDPKYLQRATTKVKFKLGLLGAGGGGGGRLRGKAGEGVLRRTSGERGRGASYTGAAHFLSLGGKV